jgi:DNA-binding transcriptional LysR family regulator
LGGADLHLADLATFLSVLRFGSIHGAARSLTVTASQVSKAVARLEQHLNVKLLVRSSRGVVVSDAGRGLAPRFEDLLSRARGLNTSERARESELTVAASAFMNSLFLPLIAEALPGYRVRSLEMPPGVAGAYASEPFFDIALTAGHEHWPESWVQTSIGTLRQGLFGAPSLLQRLGPGPLSLAQVRQETFIVPIYNYRGQVMSGDDGCPLPLAERRIGHETPTLALALALAQRTEQLVFAPALAVPALVPPGALVELTVDGWSVFERLLLVCHGERVRLQEQRQVVAALRSQVRALGEPLSCAPLDAPPALRGTLSDAAPRS